MLYVKSRYMLYLVYVKKEAAFLGKVQTYERIIN